MMLENGDPLWTGLRSTQYVDKELKLDQEQISKYVESLLSELKLGHQPSATKFTFVVPTNLHLL